jgi:superfamily II DNA or RNA helicase
MVNKFCPLVYRYTTDKAIDDNILNDYRIIVHKLILSKLKTIQQKTKKGTFWWTSEQDVYDYWCKRLDDARGPKETQIIRVMRMKALMGFPSKENLAKKLLNRSTQKCILFANTQDQADRMCPNSYHSNNPISDQNLMAFKEGTIDKLSCVLQLNEGVNIPNLKEGIIMHAYGNERKSAQRIGRLLRLNPDDTSTIHVLCYKDTVDEDWTADALRGFDSSKISWVDVA